MTKFSGLEYRFKRATSNPTDPETGDMYYDTTTNKLLRYNGAYWSGILFSSTTSTSTTTTSTSTSTTTTSTSTTTTSTSTSTTTSTSTSTSTTTTL